MSEQAEDERWLPLALMLAFLLISSAPWLALLKRPAHDAANELLSLRLWTSDLLHAGDWPLWWPYARYGFPNTTLHFASNFFNPVGLLLGMLFRFDVWTLAVENVIWRIVALTGAYAFARPHVRTALGAAVVAVCFAGSGVVVASVWERHFYPGIAIGPWLFTGVDRAISARSKQEWCGATGVLALAAAGVVWCGYPGTWLTAPFFLAPFAVVMLWSYGTRVVRLIAAATVAALLAAGMSSLFIDETVTFPLYGAAARFQIDANEGALNYTSVFAAFLANIRFIPGQFGDPVYFGLVPALLVAARCALPEHRKRVRALAVTAGALIAQWVSALPPASQGGVPGVPLGDRSADFWLACAAALFLLGAMPALGGRWKRPDVALCTTIAITFVVATRNPLADFMRRSVPPFSQVRWDWYFLWTVELIAPLVAWRALEAVAPSVRAAVRGTTRFRPPVRMGTRIIAVLAALSLFAAGSAELAAGTPDRISKIELGCEVALLAVASAVLGGARRTGHRSLPKLVVATAAFLSIAAGGAGWLLYGDDPVVRAYVALPNGGRLAIDTVQQIVVIAATGCALWRVRTTAALLRAAAIVTVLDVTLVGGWYLNDHGDYVEAQFPVRLPVPHTFTFSGPRRDAYTPQLQYEQLVLGQYKTPSMGVFAETMPHVAALDSAAGTPSIFAEFVHFPPAWLVDQTGREVWVAPTQLHGEASQEVSALPACVGTPPGAPPPHGEVTQLLGSKVIVSFQADCRRLLIYTDTWAEGWQAWIDGVPVPVLRVNGAIRGAIVPPGLHTLEWRYRPVRLLPELTLMAASFYVAVVLWATPRRS